MLGECLRHRPCQRDCNRLRICVLASWDNVENHFHCSANALDCDALHYRYCVWRLTLKIERTHLMPSSSWGRIIAAQRYHPKGRKPDFWIVERRACSAPPAAIPSLVVPRATTTALEVRFKQSTHLAMRLPASHMTLSQADPTGSMTPWRQS